MKAAKDNNLALLSTNDPTPVEWENRHSKSNVLILCEHAGNCIPQSINQLGLALDQLNSHIAWDIGAAAVSRKLAALLQAPLILQRYSRLMIDCNRPPAATSSIPETSDGITIPGNLNLTDQEKQIRLREIFNPLDKAINEGLDNVQRTAVFSIHSFTPQLHNSPPRPWHAGFLSRTDQQTAGALLRHFNQQNPDLTLALNEPYHIEDEGDWFIPRHAEARGLSHCLIEMRNDQLLDEDGINAWAGLLASAINSIMEETA